MKTRAILLAALAVGLGASVVHAQEEGAAPATTTAAAADGVLRVRVVEVAGMVQVRDSADAPWRAAVVGDEVTEGAEFRTGPRSQVVCVIDPDQTIVLDRLGTVAIAEAVREQGVARTDLVMKYGRTEYSIEEAGQKHDATIRSPSSTLAVRGTEVSLYDQPPFAPVAQSFVGRAQYTDARRKTALGTSTQGARLRANREDAADTALGDSTVDPRYGGLRSPAESRLIEIEQSRGGAIGYDEVAGIPVITGGAGPLSDADLEKSLPGSLSFVARWTANADVDLVIDNQIGDPLELIANFYPDEFIYPGFGLQTSRSGGRTDFDHRGGPNGGQEIVYWGSNYPTGIFGIQVLHASGESTPVVLNAFENGVGLNIVADMLDETGVPIVDENGLPVIEVATRIERTVAPGMTAVAIVLLPDIFAAPAELRGRTVGGEAARQWKDGYSRYPDAGPVASGTQILSERSDRIKMPEVQPLLKPRFGEAKMPTVGNMGNLPVVNSPRP